MAIKLFKYILKTEILLFIVFFCIHIIFKEEKNNNATEYFRPTSIECSFICRSDNRSSSNAILGLSQNSSLSYELSAYKFSLSDLYNFKDVVINLLSYAYVA